MAKYKILSLLSFWWVSLVKMAEKATLADIIREMQQG
jgi:hypothetical protein